MIDYLKLESEAYPGQFSRFDMEILVPEVMKLKPGQVYLEIGVDRGRSLSVAVTVGRKGVEFYGVDQQPDPRVPGANFYQGDSDKIAKVFRKKIDLLFIDGDHSYEGCKTDLESWFPLMAKGGVILLHDCDETSPGVLWAAAEFYTKNHKKLTEFKQHKKTDKNTSMATIRL